MTEKAPKPWTESRERRQLIVSASQISSAMTCVRQWWLERVRRLKPIEDQTKFTFGSVFHACCERYLLADDTGRDLETGKPVDLFPEGWKQDVSRYTGEVTGTVSEDDAGIIKALVHKGIEVGVLAPYPDRRVEREISYTIGKIESIKEKDPVTVRLVGFIDCDSRNTVIDHKTSKSRRYFLSKNKLTVEPQMMIYAKELLDDLRMAGEKPKEIVLRHNQFCKDPSDLHVKDTTATVTARYIEHYWDTKVMPTIEKMVRYRDKAMSWSDMPDPETGHNACNKYGGCAYMAICGGRITEQVMQNRLDNQAQHVKLTSSATPKPERKDNTMSLAEKLAAQKKKTGGGGGNAKPKADEPKSTKTTKPKEEAKVDELPEGMSRPPWAQGDCRACEGNGFNTAGNPCKVCDAKAPEDKKSRHYDIEAQEDGSFIVAHKDNEEEVYVCPGRDYPRAEPEASSSSKEEVTDVEEETEQPQEQETEKPDTGKKNEKEEQEEDPPTHAENGSGNFILYINCRPTKTGKGIPKTVDIHDFLNDARGQLAQDSEVDSFYDLDPFKRRDRIADLAPQISEMIGKNSLVACGIGSAMTEARALVDALKPIAKQVIVGDLN